MKVTFEDVKKNKAVQTYIRMADESLHAMGYTEHGFAHVERVAETAREILLTLGYSEREAELASIAGYLHDIGNVVNREDMRSPVRSWRFGYWTIWVQIRRIQRRS